MLFILSILRCSCLFSHLTYITLFPKINFLKYNQLLAQWNKKMKIVINSTLKFMFSIRWRMHSNPFSNDLLVFSDTSHPVAYSKVLDHYCLCTYTRFCNILVQPAVLTKKKTIRQNNLHKFLKCFVIWFWSHIIWYYRTTLGSLQIQISALSNKFLSHLHFHDNRLFFFFYSIRPPLPPNGKQWEWCYRRKRAPGVHFNTRLFFPFLSISHSSISSQFSFKHTPWTQNLIYSVGDPLWSPIRAIIWIH